MRNLILAAATAAVAMPVAFAGPADAQGYNTRRERRECARELSRADSRREYRRERRECAREINRAQARDWRAYRNYDWNRYENGQNNYYADRYYRDGRYYGEVRLRRNDRVYRGSDGRYYCRRTDGTTGLIIGGAVGALLGNAIDNGRSSVLGTLIGAGAGAALGREVDRGSVRCR
ncbi:MAG: glycine zipper 2TM domain-containing protein [Alphaproteobacteria bacterium]|nr:glycine zipper 2TM domain-containing protein [Alphaproteobacteria bacterium]MBV9373368.1 glycine zipper 2TM domain-containing protein [Alphaproteobacteria bacterium]MBV9902591.1 glycine zipper 2TM domain-containing protein [Alphaproteobacteria bacterium]